MPKIETINTPEDFEKVFRFILIHMYLISDRVPEFLDEYWYPLKSKYEAKSNYPEYSKVRILSTAVEDLLNMIEK